MEEFSVFRSDLLKELELVQGAIEKKASVPVLSNVLIDAQKTSCSSPQAGKRSNPRLLLGLFRDLARSSERLRGSDKKHHFLGQVLVKPDLDLVQVQRPETFGDVIVQLDLEPSMS